MYAICPPVLSRRRLKHAAGYANGAFYRIRRKTPPLGAGLVDTNFHLNKNQ
jgi:hypothetical protein